MKKVIVYSVLLIVGLVGSQLLDLGALGIDRMIGLLTMTALSFIMIHVGYEFEIDKSRPKQYVWDYVVASSAAMLPWILCAVYFALVMAPRAMWHSGDLWREATLEGLFAAPTSAGVLFSMLAAAGLGATWIFRKARVLAIFDDLQTVLLLIPMKALLIGMRWQLAVIAAVMIGLLWLAWKYLNRLRVPITWPWVISYAAAIVALSELVYFASGKIDPSFPIHLEVLLPAFALGCMLRTPEGQNPHADDTIEGTEEGPESPQEQRFSTIISACFMVLVGLSMPRIVGAPATTAATQQVLAFADVAPELLEAKNHFPGWGVIALHVLAITVLSNLGKMLPALCYRREAHWRERLALAIGMFPRGEVGAGVLVIALTYGLNGPEITVAVLSLALNLVGTGFFIMAVKKLIAGVARVEPAAVSV